jgi:hypothetical protein
MSGSTSLHLRCLASRSVALASEGRLGGRRLPLSIAFALSRLDLAHESVRLADVLQKAASKASNSAASVRPTGVPRRLLPAAPDVCIVNSPLSPVDETVSIFDADPGSVEGYATALAEATAHCACAPWWTRLVADELRMYAGIPATMSLCKDPILLALFLSRVCAFQTILMQHWVAQQDLWVYQPSMFKLHLHQLQRLWCGKKSTHDPTWSVEAISTTTSKIFNAASFDTFAQQEKGERKKVHSDAALELAASVFCDMLLASRCLRQQRIVMQELSQDDSLVLSSVVWIKDLCTSVGDITRAACIRVFVRLASAFVELKMYHTILLKEMVRWAAESVLSAPAASQPAAVKKRKKHRVMECQRGSEPPLPLASASDFVSVVRSVRALGITSELSAQLLHFIPLLGHATAADSARILRFLAEAKLPGSPQAVLTLLQGKKSGGSSSPSLLLAPFSPAACADLALALELWISSRKPPSRNDRRALALFCNMLMAVLRVEDAVRQLVHHLALEELCSIVNVAKKCGPLLGRSANVAENVLSTLLRGALESMTTLQHAMTLHHSYSQLKGAAHDPECSLAISRLLTTVDLLAIAGSKQEKVWVNQWCHSVRPKQLADPVRAAISKIQGWNS